MPPTDALLLTSNVLPNDTAPVIVVVPPIATLPTKILLPDTQTSSSKSTLSPNVLFVNVCVAANPANVSADAGSTKLIYQKNQHVQVLLMQHNVRYLIHSTF